MRRAPVTSGATKAAAIIVLDEAVNVDRDGPKHFLEDVGRVSALQARPATPRVDERSVDID